MSDEPLLSLRQVAEQLGRPVSSVRYYRDTFHDHVPVVGLGRRRRYPPPAVAALRAIALGFAAGRSREQIVSGLDGGAGRAAAWPLAGRGDGGEPAVSGAELLAAIEDGRREQREALLRMAEEIVRLTGVLDAHERTLTALAARTGLGPGEPPALVGGTAPVAALGEGSRAPGPGAPGPAAEPGPSPGLPSGPELERLRAELEAERQLVERLREAKVKLEHRVVDAESELEERRRRRASVLERILRPGERE